MLKLKIARIMVILLLFALGAGGAMASSSEAEKILEAAVAGIPRVAQAIAETPAEHRAKALEAAERSYRQTVRDLGYDEGPIQGWVSAVMLRLQTEVRKQESTKQKMLEALQEELAQAAIEVDSNVVPIERSEEQ
jgi:molybdopterin-biosynthesis enzyme MoeA-like protein